MYATIIFTGKTTSVHALARELLGPAYKDACLELNASDARGIDVVRNRIKSFAQNKITLPPGRCVMSCAVMCCICRIVLVL